MHQLNPPQLEAVHYTDGPLLVLAGAGSGKTRVITYKIAHLVQHHVLPARSIVAVTFTNKAAQEMKQRVAEHLSKEEARGLNVSTFHTLGLKILQREHEKLNYRHGFSIFDAKDALSMMTELSMQHGQADKDEIRAVLSQISRWKNDFLAPKQAAEATTTDFEAFAARLYAAYSKQLKVYNAMDFDDLITLPTQLLLNDAITRAHWQTKIRHLLVDEYQDTNATQYELIKALIGHDTPLTAVGDDHQSIYSWRGARPENMEALHADYPHLKTIKLEQNYRSVGRVLKLANQLISHNEKQFSKNLWSELGHGDPVRVIGCASDLDEATHIAVELSNKKFQTQCKFKDMAVLYRSNFQSRVLEQALREHRIPYKITGGTSFFERSEIKDLMAYLKVMANPDDDTSFLRIINTPKREIGTKTLERLGAYAHERSCSLFTACFEIGLKQTLSDKAYAKLNHFVNWLTLMSDNATRGDTFGVLLDVIHHIHYRDYIQEHSNTPKQAEMRLKNIDDWLEWIKRLIEEDDKDLRQLATHMTLMGILENQDKDEEYDAVNLMTLHASKGLEFPHVFIIGVEEDLLPHINSIEGDTIEEERRLMYVGITRAQRSLTLLHSHKRRRGGEVVTCEISRFVSELPQDELEYEGVGVKVDEEKSMETGRTALANMKAMLENKQ